MTNISEVLVCTACCSCRLVRASSVWPYWSGGLLPTPEQCGAYATPVAGDEGRVDDGQEVKLQRAQVMVQGVPYHHNLPATPQLSHMCKPSHMHACK